MNKSELVAVMVKKSGLSRKHCEAALDAFVAATGDALKNGEKVHLVGFGTLLAAGAIRRLENKPRSQQSAKKTSVRKGKVFMGPPA